jgi:phytoene/squalene synthetase
MIVNVGEAHIVVNILKDNAEDYDDNQGQYSPSSPGSK